MKARATQKFSTGDVTVQAGQIIDFPDEKTLRIIGEGLAVPLEAQPEAKAQEPAPKPAPPPPAPIKSGPKNKKRK